MYKYAKIGLLHIQNSLVTKFYLSSEEKISPSLEKNIFILKKRRFYALILHKYTISCGNIYFIYIKITAYWYSESNFLHRLFPFSGSYQQGVEK